MEKRQKQNHISTQSSKTPQDRNNAVTINMEDKIELERREAYVEPKTRDILQTLLQSGDQFELKPIYSPSAGYFYELPDPENKRFNSSITKEYLLNLVRLNILSKVFYDSVSSCPKCESVNLTLHNRCPKCKSHNIEKTGLSEHIPCGYIDQIDKYVDNRCPKCGELLIEGTYRNMGRWYICHECSEKFENPELDLSCHSCNRNFPTKELHIQEVPKFKLNLARIKEIRQNVASLEEIKELLTQLGFAVEMPGYALGQKSGMQHHFSLIAKKIANGKEILIALDHSVSEEEVQTSSLILYIYKISEVNVDIPIFVAIPMLNETAKKIAEGHKIILIEETTDQKQITESIKRAVEDKSEPPPQVKANPPEKKRSLFKLRG